MKSQIFLCKKRIMFSAVVILWLTIASASYAETGQQCASNCVGTCSGGFVRCGR